MITPTDPDTLPHGNVAGPSLVLPVGRRILELFPLPRIVYESVPYFYDSATDLTQGDFAAVLTFAVAYGPPTVIHKCQDLQNFQATHPSALVFPFSEVPVAHVKHGWFLLASMGTLVPPVAAPQAQGALALADQASYLSSFLLTHSSHAASCGRNPPSGALVWGAPRVTPPPVYVAHSVWGPNSCCYQQPDPDASEGSTSSVGGASCY